MASEDERVEFGMTDKGAVVMLRLLHYKDDGEHIYHTYQVRHGVRTVGEYSTRGGAERVAKALVH